MSAQDTINDLTAGTIGGAAGIIAGQPFDTIKVRMQSRGHLYRSTWDCFRSTVRDEGVRGLYKGMASPLVGNAPMNALLFAGYRGTLRLLDPDADPVVGCPASHIYTAGIVAGVLQCVIIAPADLIKCQMQVQMGRKALITPLQCAKQMVAHNGWRNGLFRGWWITFLRDAPTYGLYFVSYEKMRLGMERYFPRGEDGKPSALPALLAGGLAGMVTWLSVYPLDVVKSIIQTTPADCPLEERKIGHVFSSNYKQHGTKFFFRGLESTMLRAFPVNAVTFFVYEWVIHLMNNNNG